MRAVRTLRYAVIDVETTGLDPAVDQVVSIAVVPVDDGMIQIDQARHIYVNPGIGIPLETTILHGISDSDVVDADDLRTVLGQLSPVLR